MTTSSDSRSAPSTFCPSTPEATFESLDADSLDLVELVMALEEEFDVNVEEEELEGVNTIQAAFDLVTSKL